MFVKMNRNGVRRTSFTSLNRFNEISGLTVCTRASVYARWTYVRNFKIPLTENLATSITLSVLRCAHLRFRIVILKKRF